jgi:hypothetical protein
MMLVLVLVKQAQVWHSQAVFLTSYFCEFTQGDVCFIRHICREVVHGNALVLAWSPFWKSEAKPECC